MKNRIYIAAAIVVLIGCATTQFNRNVASSDYSSWDNYSSIVINTVEGLELRSDRHYRGKGTFIPEMEKIKKLLGPRDVLCIEKYLDAQAALKDRFEDVGAGFIQNRFLFEYDRTRDPKMKLLQLSALPDAENGGYSGLYYYGQGVWYGSRHSTYYFSEQKPCNPDQWKKNMENLLKDRTGLYRDNVEAIKDRRIFEKEMDALSNDLDQ